MVMVTPSCREITKCFDCVDTIRKELIIFFEPREREPGMILPIKFISRRTIEQKLQTLFSDNALLPPRSDVLCQLWYLFSLFYFNVIKNG